MRNAILIIGFTALLALATSDLAAQQTGPRRAPVAVVLTDAPPIQGEIFVVERRANHYPHDVIHLTHAATDVNLSAAVRALLTARAKDGPTPPDNQHIRLSDRRTELRAAFPWARGVVNDLSQTGRITIDGLGEVQGLIIWVPAHGQ